MRATIPLLESHCSVWREPPCIIRSRTLCESVQGGRHMTQYREILRLYQHGISQRSIALSCKCSRNTVSAVLQRAKEANLQWPVDEKTDTELEALLFPEKQVQQSTRRMPDYELVARNPCAEEKGCRIPELVMSLFSSSKIPFRKNSCQCTVWPPGVYSACVLAVQF